jgi:hypothetical protein
MPLDDATLRGAWEKITFSPCSEPYPDRLEFRDHGRYVGQKDMPGIFTTWDVGSFERVSDKQVKISTASDSIVSYEFSAAGDIITFVDPQKCEIKYRRAR